MAVNVGLNPTAARPYKNDGYFNAPHLIVATLLGMTLAVAAGAFLSFIGCFFTMIFLFPIVLAIILGTAFQWTLRAFHVRSRFACVLAAIVVGLTAMTTMHAADYGFMKMYLAIGEYSIETVKEDFAEARSPEEKAALANLIVDYQKAHKIESYFDYLKYRIDSGIVISSTFDRKISRITDSGVYAYWLLEALIVIGYVAAANLRRGAAPYCRQCRQWKDKTRFGYLPADPKLVSKVISSGQLQELPEIPKHDRRHTVVSGYACPHCEFGCDPVIAVDIANSAKKAKDELSRTVVTSEAALALRSFIEYGRVANSESLKSAALATSQ